MAKKKTGKRSPHKPNPQRRLKKIMQKAGLLPKQLLKSPNLLDRLVAEVQKSVAGESDTIKAILICTFGRLVIDGRLTSFNLVAVSLSGSGKDHVIKGCLNLHPDKCVERCKSMTPKVFRYWHTAYRTGSSNKWKGDLLWSWNGMICYIEDPSPSVLNDDTFKVMLSSDIPYAYAVEKQKVVQISVNGKPVVIISAASANLKEQFLRRVSVVYMDESEEQTKRIIRQQNRHEEQPDNHHPTAGIKHAMGMLKRVRVKIPFARKIGRFFPTSHINARTAYPRFLDLIRASAALHQYQRESLSDDTIEATWTDYDIARLVLHKTTTNTHLVPISGCKKEILDAMKDNESDFDNGWFSTNFLKGLTGIEYNLLYYHLKGLLKDGLIESDSEVNPNTSKAVVLWKLIEVDEIHLPESKDIV